MTVTVLIVDDSGFFRRRLGEMINGFDGLKVVGAASNGREAIDMVLKLKPDVVTMDYEMPVMDGITAVRHIMDQCPTPILMFSSLTYEGARVTLDSLEAGAVDYLPKNFEEISKSSAVLKKKLAERILTVAGAGKGSALKQTVASSAPAKAPSPKPAAPAPTPRAPTPRVPAARKSRSDFELVAIGTSTGGPVALQNVLTQLQANFPLPIVLIQHMPSTFTSAFAERLNSLCKISVVEAKDGDTLRPGVAMLAPGGKQMMIVKGGRVKVLPGDERLNYKPSVDITFGSAANVFNDKVLAVVLTGMGSDGCEGAKLLKQRGATVWAQDEATSVIYGMPMAVAKANLADEILPLAKVGKRLSEIG
ncbi:MAG: chemotaxis response regulator protein-glutamate methylesterase [Oceanicoccus sp.]|uniref:protein-glutamate methylesterase/protein-glutamine glutaminase n=1 Tax=Oceanicoccus sp. TaxID=2691044 RepID=UPI0026040BAF|nr:chemotaxis response regulator protein-glutamate methylesterase [Oceanicoccus sp.]MCP3909108.1 chemotaxis response regulator protein-glutamate methylesterase [Oceanicoccus sp.]MDG1773533.1 chemotaxis response regulator protein-glutamate methylesterase [Oceanicoccus sp.]